MFGLCIKNRGKKNMHKINIYNFIGYPLITRKLIEIELDEFNN